MTPIDKALDPSPLTEESPLTLYRLAARKYASLSGLALMTIHLSGNWRVSAHIALDFATGALWNICPALRYATASPESVALAVPSVIVPAWNVVLYPRATQFGEHVSLASVEPFDYDPRFFPAQPQAQP